MVPKPIRFEPPWWLQNSHIQSLYQYMVGKRLPLDSTTEIFELIDGDFIEGIWVGKKEGPIVIILHGLLGSMDSYYTNSLMNLLQERGWRCLLFNFRNGNNKNSRLQRLYHMGDTQDLHNIISIIKNREPKTLMAGIGFSLGANVLTKWMGEMGVNSPLSCAVSISNPFNLEIASRSASKTTFGRFYEKRLVKLMKQRLKEKYADIPSSEILIDLNKAYAAETFRAFDTIVTAPLHQFSSLEDYYQKSSSCFRIKDIKKPMLFINAFDDPIIEPNALPIKERFPSTSTVEYYQTGGHVGFIQSSKKQPWKIESWLNNRILNYIYPFLYEQ